MDSFEEKLLEIIDDQSSRALYRLAELYAQSPVKAREIIRRNWDFKREWKWPGVYTLACGIDGEPDPIIKIRSSLIIGAIMNGGPDYREDLMHLAIVYLSAPHAGLDPDQLFEEVAQISAPEFAAALRRFSGRDAAGKSLKAWCLKEEWTSKGVRFVLLPPDPRRY